MAGEITVLKLINGEEVLGEVTAEYSPTTGQHSYVIKNPAVIGMVPDPNGGMPKIGMGEYVPLADQKEIRINFDKVLFEYSPKKPIKDHYTSMFSPILQPQRASGLILPS